MINDLLELTDSKILLLCQEDVADSIVNLLRINGYCNFQCSDNLNTAINLYQITLPDLIIFQPLPNLSLADLTNTLKINTSSYSTPPIFFVNDSNDHIPLIDTGAKDFINIPIDKNEFSYRLHHLLHDWLACQELHEYNQTILNTVEQRNRELKSSTIDIIECLGYAAEFRDSETGMHTIRVGRYTQCLAKALGMNEIEAESLLYSAPMHDVGKIGIPDRILLKPGKLDIKEWDIMKQHTVIGEKILNRSKNKLLHQASIIALSHHEKWDGNGYPNGLSGIDIPIYGRLVAIVDVFDALTMDRPYKKAWPINSALDYINAESGKHFDPSLVELFNKSIKEIIDIKITLTDDNSHTEFLNDYLSF